MRRPTHDGGTVRPSDQRITELEEIECARATCMEGGREETPDIFDNYEPFIRESDQ